MTALAEAAKFLEASPNRQQYFEKFVEFYKHLTDFTCYTSINHFFRRNQQRCSIKKDHLKNF